MQSINFESITVQHLEQQLSKIIDSSQLQIYSLEQLDTIINEFQNIRYLALHFTQVCNDLIQYFDFEQSALTAYKTYLSSQLVKDFLSAFVPNDDIDKRFINQLVIHIENPNLQNLKNTLRQNQNIFAQNVINELQQNVLILKYSEDLLCGLSPEFVKQISFEQVNEIRIKNTRTAQIEIMSHAESEQLRFRFWSFQQNFCPQNLDVLKQQLELKKQIALQQNQTVSQCYLKNRIIQNETYWQQFYDKILLLVGNAILEDLSMLKVDQPWNFNYFSEQYKKRYLNFDFQQVKFRVDSALPSIIEFIANFFNVQIQSCNISVWHPDVLAFQVLTFGHEKAHIYLDLYERATKNTGGWFQKIDNSSFSVQCNFISKQEFSLNDVETLFHEFGHLFHAIFSDTRFEFLNAIDVAWDFVEVPSTFLEYYSIYWMQTQVSPLVFSKIEQKNKLLQSLVVARQLQFSLADYYLHTAEQVIDNPYSYLDQQYGLSLSKYFKISEKPKISWFTHIFGNTHDYTCGYYSYMLSDVVACNFLNRFLSDKDVTKYIETVLKVGNQVDVKEIIQNYCIEIDYSCWTNHLGI